MKKKIVLMAGAAVTLIWFRKEFIVELTRQGYEVHCFAYGYNDKIRQEVISWGGIPHDHIINPKGMNILKDIKASIHFFKALKNISPDIVFTTFVKPVIFGGVVAKLAKVPRIVGMIEGLGNGFTRYKEGATLKSKVLRLVQVLLYKLALPRLDKLILLNPDDKKDLIDAYGIKTKEVDILGGIGVDLEKFAFSLPPQNEISFIFIARLLKEKGIFEFLAAAEIIKKEYPSAKFRILGGFDLENPFGLAPDTLEYYIKNNIVEYLGQVDNVAEMLSQSSVFVLPSFYREGVPRSTQEAMAVGRAIITTDVAGCRETVENNRNGFLIPPYSAEAVADKMRYFIEHPEAVITMGQESRKIAEQKFNINEVNQRLIKLLEG